MQSRSTVLRAERVHRAVARHERVMHVVVELEERLIEIRALADLRTDRNQLAGGRRNEVPMWRYVGDEQVRRIRKSDAGKDGQRDDGAYADERELESSLHFLPLSERACLDEKVSLVKARSW